jgi:DNA-binding PadR family transcriptional regulator
MRERGPNPISHLEFQVLLVLAEGPSYGYAIMQGVEEQSIGRLNPDIGSLYRLLSRLAARGMVEEQKAPKDSALNHRGSPRKYYGLTPLGLQAVRQEALHLDGLVATARTHQILPDG